MHVGILGGGNWGQALARLAMAAGNRPLIVYRDKREKPPHILSSTRDPAEAVSSCDLILVATSASEVRQAIRLAQPGPGNRVVVAGRGIEPETGRWLSTAVEEECGAVRVGALAGPAPVEEILNGGLCAGVVASPFDEVRTMVLEALHSTRYRVYESSDLTGVQIASAVVPVLAALVGLTSNLSGSGVGMHAMVVSRGLAEAARLARALGGDSASIWGLAGMGDLVSAQGRPGHPSYETGRLLGSGKTPRKETGVERIARSLAGLAKENGVEMPLTEGLLAIFEGADPLEAVGRLMSRKAAFETR